MTHTIESRFNENIDLILESLGVDFQETNNRYFFACPIHLSDNYSSLTIYKSGQWRCFTQGCHTSYPKGIVGFVMGLRRCDRESAISICSSALNLPRTQPKRIYTPKRPIYVDRSKILPLVNPQIEFYLRRGYSEDILKKYDVFICKKKYNLLYGRIVFPIYNEEANIAVGFVGRTMKGKCELCNKFHQRDCPCPIQPFEKMRAEKWLNSSGFSRNNHLFNYWFAKEFSEEFGVILVEGQGDVLKLEMAGIHNSMGIFGTELTQSQINLLDKSGATRIYIATDDDRAGINANAKITKQLAGRFDLINMTPPEKDFGDMTVDEIKQFFKKRNECHRKF